MEASHLAPDDVQTAGIANISEEQLAAARKEAESSGL